MILTSWLLILSLTALAGSDPSPTQAPPPELLAPELDVDGLLSAAQAHLDAGRLGPAIELLEVAVAERPADSPARLLLAEALSQIRVEHPQAVCDWGAWPDVIWAHLRAAAAVDPTVRERARTDPGLRTVRQALADSLGPRLWALGPRDLRRTGRPTPRLVAGLPVLEVPVRVRHRALDEVATGLTWHRADDPDHVLALLPDGRLWRAAVERDLDGEKVAVHAPVGSWRVGRGDALWLTTTWTSDVPTTLRYRLTDEGLIPVDDGPRWTDQPKDCTRPFDPWASHPTLADP